MGWAPILFYQFHLFFLDMPCCKEYPGEGRALTWSFISCCSHTAMYFSNFSFYNWGSYLSCPARGPPFLLFCWNNTVQWASKVLSATEDIWQEVVSSWDIVIYGYLPRWVPERLPKGWRTSSSSLSSPSHSVCGNGPSWTGLHISLDTSSLCCEIVNPPFPSPSNSVHSESYRQTLLIPFCDSKKKMGEGEKMQGAIFVCWASREHDKWLQGHLAFWKTFSYYWDSPPHCPPRGAGVGWHLISCDSRQRQRVLSSALLMQPGEACQRRKAL